MEINYYVKWHWWNIPHRFAFQNYLRTHGINTCNVRHIHLIVTLQTGLSWLSYVRTMLIERYPWWVSNLPLVDPTILFKSMNTVGPSRCLGKAVSLDTEEYIKREYTAEVDYGLAYSFDTMIDTWSLTHHWPPFFNSSFVRTL